MTTMDTGVQYRGRVISSLLYIYSKLYDLYKVSPATRTWIIGWMTLLENIFMLIIFALILPAIHNEEPLEYLCNEPISRVIVVIKGMQLFFSAILLIGTYKGQRVLIFSWIVAASSLSAAGIVVFTMIIVLTPYYLTAIALLMAAACDLCCIVLVINFYKYKDSGIQF